MKIITFLLLITLIPMTLWAGGQKDSEGSGDAGIEQGSTEETEASLLDMVESGDAAGIEKMLKVDINLNETDESGRTALHAAAESGDAEIAAILLIRGAQIDPKDDLGRTPLFLAVDNSHSEVVEVLSDSGADISIVDASGNSPASLGLKKPSGQLNFLLNKENIDSIAVDGVPILHAAASRGLSDHLNVIIEQGANTAQIDAEGLTALDNALKSTVTLNHAICASTLLKSASPPPQDADWKYIVEPLRTGNLEIRFDYGSTALHFAAERGHEGMVRYLIDNEADIEARDQPGNTPLHVAVRKGYRRIATLLLDKGADVNARDYNGNAPIHESLTANDDYAMTSLLIDRGADPNIKNGSGSTPLHLTVLLMSDVSGPRLLIERGALVDPRDRNGNTPLLLAVEATDRELAELFLSEGADIFARNNKGLTPAEGALSYGADVSEWFFTGSLLTATDNEGRSVLHMAVAMAVSTDTLEVLLDAGAIPDIRDSNGETAIHYAVADAFIPLAVTLLDYNADPFIENNDGVTPLILAFDHGGDITVAVLSGRIDIQDRWGNTALFHAVHWEYPAILEALLSAGADPRHKNKQGSTVLHEAVHTDSLEMAAMLIDAGANPNSGDNMGRTPMHDAVTWDTFRILKLLSQRGAQMDARDGTGQTALHLAAFTGNNEIAGWLLGSGASPDVRDNNGQTPLFITAESNRVDTARLLLVNGSNLLLRDKNGRTVLHIAITSGHIEISRFLIQSGSDIFAVDGSGRTPFDLAMEDGPALLSGLMDRSIVNKQDNSGNTPLHLAVIAGADEAVIRILLDEGADRRARNASGKTPGDIALNLGSETIAALVM